HHSAWTGACRKKKSANKPRFQVDGLATAYRPNPMAKCYSWRTVPRNCLQQESMVMADGQQSYRTPRRCLTAIRGQLQSANGCLMKTSSTPSSRCPPTCFTGQGLLPTCGFSIRTKTINAAVKS